MNARMIRVTVTTACCSCGLLQTDSRFIMLHVASWINFRNHNSICFKKSDSLNGRAFCIYIKELSKIRLLNFAKPRCPPCRCWLSEMQLDPFHDLTSNKDQSIIHIHPSSIPPNPPDCPDPDCDPSVCKSVWTQWTEPREIPHFSLTERTYLT